MRTKQKGQSLVEFAVMLPLLLIIVMGLLGFGLYFSDYVALNSIARSIAREASVMDNSTKTWKSINQSYVDNAGSSTLNTYYLPNSAYVWDPTEGQGGLVIEKSGKNVKVTAKATVADTGGPLHALSGLMGDQSFFSDITVTYEMYWEYYEDS